VGQVEGSGEGHSREEVHLAEEAASAEVGQDQVLTTEEALVADDC